MSLKLRSIPVVVFALAALSGTAVAGAASAAPVTPSTSAATSVAHAAAEGEGLQCMPGLSPTIGFDANGEVSMPLPASFDYPASGESKPAGQGMNPSSVGYRIDVTSSTGSANTKFGTYATDRGQGVPWNQADAGVRAGKIAAWALDAPRTGKYTVTITYDKPVYGMRTAVTDLDVGGENIQMDAFAEKTGGTAVPVDVKALKNPDTIPELGADKTHTGNTAYIQDDTRVRNTAQNTFSLVKEGNVTDATGSVYFAYDSETPVQRLEMTYEVRTSAGFWFVPPSIPQACVQPQFDISDVSEGGIATLNSTIANQAGSGRVEDIGFTYTLPEGVVVADPANIVAPACAGTVTAVPGSSTITVAGAAVASGASNCDFSVDLRFVTPGTKTFDSSIISGASNIVTGGTASSMVEVTPDAPALTATLQAALEGGGTGKPKVGDKVVYSSTITNTGNAPLTKIDAVDARATAIQCAALPIAAGASAECSSTKPYVVTQADLDAGTVHNELTATGTTGSGRTAAAPVATAELPLEATPLIVSDLTGKLKTAGKTVRVGDTASYSSTVTNSGNVTVSTVSITDDLATAMTCDASELAPGESTECASTAPYALTQADIDAGMLHNGSAAAGVAASGDTVASVKQMMQIELPAKAAAETSIAVNASGEVIGVGTEASYVLTVTNTGNVTLTADQVAGSLGSAFTCAAPVAPGASVECASDASYVLTQADVDAGRAENVVTGSLRTPSGAALELPKATGVLEIKASPGLEAQAAGTISAKNPEVVMDGDRIEYTAVVTNTGNVTLSTLALTDGAFTCEVTELAPGESTNCVLKSHKLTQGDVDAGSVVAAYVFHAVAPSGDDVAAQKSTVHTSIAAVPLIEAEPTAKLDQGDDKRVDAGDKVAYTVTVKNTGNVTLNGASLLGSLGTVFICETALAPGDSALCLGDAPSSITQTQLDAGEVVNTISGNASTPSAATVEIPAMDEMTELRAAPGLDAEVQTSLRVVTGNSSKMLAADGKTVVVPGDGLVYTMTVTNTGNVTIDDVTIDERPATAIGCPSTPIAPGKSITCTSSTPYAITQTDINLGEVTHRAVATGSAPHAVEETETTEGAGRSTSGEAVRITSGEVTTVTPLAPVPAAPSLASTGFAGGQSALVMALVAGLLGMTALLIAARRRQDTSARD